MTTAGTRRQRPSRTHGSAGTASPAKARKAGLFDGHDIVSTVKVRVSFTDIGKRQHIVAPKHAITVHSVG
ncbi:MAG TPA: hypothetical protein VFQ44_07835 [Streptosporangiaceae bacterium]|nr:hypothetical protein [Streptosporangiaceae bacterium]